MNRIKITGLLCAALVLIASCKRDAPQTDSPSSTNASAVTIEAKDLVVPANFNFSSEKTLNVRVKVADAKAGERYVIKVYSDVPTTGKLISTGATNANGEYANIIQIPAWEEFIYIEKINPDGSSQFEKVKANQFAAAVFNGSQTNAPYIFTKKSSGTDCNTGCSVTYNNPTSDITVAAGLTACITGTIGSNVKLTLGSNSKVKICASGTFKEAIISSGAEFYILENATVRINKFTNGYSYFNVYNWSDSVVIDSTTGYSFAPNLMDNYGKIYTPRFGVGTRVRNYGKLVVTGDFSIGAYSTMQNDGFFKVTGNMEIGTLSDFFNNCRIEVGVNLTQQGYFYHNGYVKVGETFIHTTSNTEWPNGTALYPGSLISTKNFLLGYGGIGGNNSFIKVSNTTTITGGSMNLSTFCDINGIETKTGGDISGATLSCNGYLSTSTCNPEGFGSQSTTDTDNDGIVNAYDEYPNDANRAFNSFYPNASTTATVAFEDLWPAKADYDFNDLALAFNIQQVLNANNDVVEYKVKMRVKAIGGSYVNGFGFQLDGLVPSDIASITGQVLTQNLITRNANNTEAGQSKAVIICYDSPEPTLNRVGGSMFNTLKTNGTGSSDSIRINIVFSTPQAASKLTFTKFNPFIFTNKRRGYEIHMANYRPTDLANTNLFGTFDDRTNPINNEFYKTTNGMPWAILIPENFVYPIEKTPITGGYNFFDDWAISGGSGYTNWYNNSPGNRNTNGLY